MVLYVHVVVVVILDVLLGDVFELLWRKGSQQVPRFVQRVEDCSDVVRPLGDELIFEPLQKLQEKKIVLRKSLFSDDSLHSHGVLSHSVIEVELVGNLLVVGPGSLVSDGRLHETTETGQDVDWRVDVSIVELSIEVNLTLGDVAS